jgi:hypothetical protein
MILTGNFDDLNKNSVSIVLISRTIIGRERISRSFKQDSGYKFINY